MKITIITVTKNDTQELARTLESIRLQHYSQKELVVVNGGSSSGTVELIRKNMDLMASCISEPDHGIFDAMNKGLARSTGEWVIFMNAGDVFSSGDVLSELAGFIEKEGDSGVGREGVIYGDSIADYGRFRIYRPAGQPADLWKGMICNHQSMLFRREALLNLTAGRSQHGHPACFDTTLGISADHDLVCRLYVAGHGFGHVPVAVAVWDTRGISNKHQIMSVVERYRMTGSYFNQGLKVKVYYLWLLILAGLVQGMYRLLPQKLMDALIRIANRKSLVNQ
jgi:glycosyltransferase involved in cell wall biosynthesis